MCPPPTHWALDPRYVILKSQIWKIWKLAKSYSVWCLTTLMRVVILFQTSFVRIWEIYYGNFEEFLKNALTWSIFELEKCFRQKLIGTIICMQFGTYVHSLASIIDKDPYEVKCHIRAHSVCLYVSHLVSLNIVTCHRLYVAYHNFVYEWLIKIV